MPLSAPHTGSFQNIYNDTYPKLFHFMYRLTGKDKALTDDLVQNCYIRLWDKFEKLPDQDNYLPLLYTIAKGFLTDHYRKLVAEQQKLAAWKSLQPGEAADTTELALSAREIHTEITKALAAMPARRREIFLLCREQGLSHKEIASRLNIKVHSVEQQMTLALKFLRQEFGHLQGGAPVIHLMISLSALIAGMPSHQ